MELRYKLNGQGVAVTQELITLLGYGDIKQHGRLGVIEADFGIDGTSVSKIMKNLDNKGFVLSELKRFLETGIERLERGEVATVNPRSVAKANRIKAVQFSFNQNKNIEKFKIENLNHGYLQNIFAYYRSGFEGWPPKLQPLEDFCTEIDKISTEKINDVLCNLNYSVQLCTFNNIISRDDRIYSFSIVASKIATQKWLLERLIQRFGRCLKVSKDLKTFKPRIFNINLSDQCDSNRYDRLLIEFSKQNKIASQDNILGEMCDCRYSNILVIQGHSSDSKRITTKLFQELWKINHAKRTSIMIFWLGSSHPEYFEQEFLDRDLIDTGQANEIEAWVNQLVNNLDELSQITESDIDELDSTYLSLFPDGWRKINFQIHDRTWENPSDMLDWICSDIFGILGFNETKQHWKYVK
jgi:hypothetical protein